MPPRKDFADVNVIAERFWAKVNKHHGNGCWLWTGSRSPSGYGRFSVGPRANCRRVGAHRFAWESTYGPISAGLFVCHHCDTPPCVRPDHLFLGDQTDNMGDCSTKGRINKVREPKGAQHWTKREPERIARGEAHHAAKLTDAQVQEIRALYVPGVRGSKAALARQFGISKFYVNQLIMGQSRRASTS